MPVPADRTEMGQKFSDITVSHETRLEQINSILYAARQLYSAIDAEIAAETTAALVDEYVDPTWDDFRANGTEGEPIVHGINDPVQERGAELYDAIAALP